MEIEKLIPSDSKESKKNLSFEDLERLLEIKISHGTTWETIKRNMKLGGFLRFIVTKDFDIYIGTSDHNGIRDDNGIDIDDCVIGNGSFQENDEGRVEFIYYTIEKTSFHEAIEKKIVSFFKDKGINFVT